MSGTKIVQLRCSSCTQTFDVVPDSKGSMKMPEHDALCGLPCGFRVGVNHYHGMAPPPDKLLPNKIATWCPCCSYVNVVDRDANKIVPVS